MTPALTERMPDPESSSESPEVKVDTAPAEAEAVPPADEAAPAPAEPVDELEATRVALAEIEDLHLRLQAEFENFRKRTARDRGQIRATATEEVTRSFLSIVDNFDRALAAARDQGLDEDHLSGWRLIHQQLYDVLGGLQVTPMDVLGQPFNPTYHEAVAHMPSEDVAEGHVATEVGRGYMIGDRVLRIARVTVSSGPAAAAGATEEEE